WLYLGLLIPLVLGLGLFFDTAARFSTALYLLLTTFVIGLTWLSVKVTFRYERHHLDRIALRPALSVFFDDWGKRGSYAFFAGYILLCLGFIGGGIFLLIKGLSALMVGSVIATFGAFLVGAVYALLRTLGKLALQGHPTR